MLAKVLGGCFPWLDRSAEDLERDLDKASTFEGKPNAIVIVKVEKCVHLPPMVNNETSNPFIEIKSRGKRQETQIVRQTLDPLFEETFDMDHNTNDQVRGIELIVYHSKFGGGKQFLGKLIVDLSGTKMGDMIKMKAWELKAEDGTTPVTCKDPGDGRTVTSNIFISWNISLKPEALVSIRVSNARNINSPDSRGLGFPFIKIKFDDRVLKSQAATELEHPRWDQSISFNTLSVEQLQILPTHARPSPKMRIEVWDSKAIGDDIFIGSCETDISKVRYETRSEMEWNRLSDKTRARRANVGDIKFSVAWGPNVPTILTVQIEEGYALTKHLASSLLTQVRPKRPTHTDRPIKGIHPLMKRDPSEQELTPMSCVRAGTEGKVVLLPGKTRRKERHASVVLSEILARQHAQTQNQGAQMYVKKDPHIGDKTCVSDLMFTGL